MKSKRREKRQGGEREKREEEKRQGGGGERDKREEEKTLSLSSLFFPLNMKINRFHDTSKILPILMYYLYITYTSTK